MNLSGIASADRHGPPGDGWYYLGHGDPDDSPSSLIVVTGSGVTQVCRAADHGHGLRCRRQRDRHDRRPGRASRPRPTMILATHRRLPGAGRASVTEPRAIPAPEPSLRPIRPGHSTTSRPTGGPTNVYDGSRRTLSHGGYTPTSEPHGPGRPTSLRWATGWQDCEEAVTVSSDDVNVSISTAPAGPRWPCCSNTSTVGYDLGGGTCQQQRRPNRQIDEAFDDSVRSKRPARGRDHRRADTDPDRLRSAGQRGGHDRPCGGRDRSTTIPW